MANFKKIRRGASTNATSLVLIRSKPLISDPRELATILTFSLRSLFGEVEHHSCLLEVLLHPEDNNVDGATLSVKCPTESVPAVRAALTMVSVPVYLSSTIYRFDVVKVGRVEG
jgi:RNase P/RNase MRP subunit POP5